LGFQKDPLCPSDISPEGENPSNLILLNILGIGTWNFGMKPEILKLFKFFKPFKHFKPLQTSHFKN